MLIGVVAEFGKVLLVEVVVEAEPSVRALFEVFVFEALVVVDSEDALHVSPHLSGGLAETPWWL